MSYLYRILTELLTEGDYAKHYEFKIDEYYFIMQSWNKYRWSSHEDLTIYVSKYSFKELQKNRGLGLVENYPCYWLNHEQGKFTNYFYSGRNDTQATKYTCYERLLGEGATYKDFYKLQKKYNQQINEMLILAYRLDKIIPNKPVAGNKKNKI